MSEYLKGDSSKMTVFQRNNQAVGVTRPVYGAQHPPRQDRPQQQHQQQPQKKDKIRGRDAFQAFQEKTSDAWDDGDDDLLTASARTKLHGSAALVSRSGRAEPVVVDKMADKTGRNNLDFFQVSSSAPNTPMHHRYRHPGSSGIRMGATSRPPTSKTSANAFSSFPTAHPVLSAADRDTSKREKFKSLFKATNIDLDELRNLSWSGIVSQYRPETWKILSNYLPPIVERHSSTLERKRVEYHNYVEQYYSTRHQEIHQETYRQIQTDVPRMSPLIPLFQQELVQEIFERILYIWSIRHPASGYVQGINDLVTPFFVVFLSEYVASDVNVECVQVSSVPNDLLQNLEADCFWCFSKLLDGIQDNYTFAQPGIQTRINSLKELVSRIDNGLHRHLEKHKVEYLQFSFRWMNNLLMRELPLRCVIRLWDTYLSEPDGFASFHLYVCAAFLTKFSQELLLEQDFHGLMLMLQNLPTHHWTDVEIGLVLAEAYRLKYTFADAPKHFKNDSSAAVVVVANAS